MEQNRLDSVIQNFLALIKAVRIEQQLTLEQLAEQAGIHRTMVGLLERHERVPTIQVANQIAHALGFSLSDLVQMAELISLEENSKYSEFLKPRKPNRLHIRNEQTLLELMGIEGSVLLEAIEYAYGVLDTIDRKLISSQSPVVAELVELANFSSMLGNLIGSGIAKSSEGLYMRNRPHAYPDLLPLKAPAVDVELKMALESNKPKGHLPKAGVYITFRYVLGDREGNFIRGKENRGNTAWMWEIKVGYIGEDDFSISNTTGDSGKTAVIKTDVHNKMPLVYYDPRFLPYSPRKGGIYPGFN